MANMSRNHLRLTPAKHLQEHGFFFKNLGPLWEAADSSCTVPHGRERISAGTTWSWVDGNLALCRGSQGLTKAVSTSSIKILPEALTEVYQTLEQIAICPTDQVDGL